MQTEFTRRSFLPLGESADAILSTKENRELIAGRAKKVAKYVFDTLLSHPAWTGIGSIAAIVAIVLAVKSSPIQPSKHHVAPPNDSAIIYDSKKPSASHHIAYWDADSYYSHGLYAQAARAYLLAIDSIPQAHQIDTKEEVERTAKDAYKLGNYKLAADQLKELLGPLAEQGVFGRKQTK